MSRRFVDVHPLSDTELSTLTRLLALLHAARINHAIRYSEPPVLLWDHAGTLDRSIALGCVNSEVEMENIIFHLTKPRQAI